LNDALLIGGNAGEISAIQDRVLQSTSFEQGLLTSDFGNTLGGAQGRLAERCRDDLLGDSDLFATAARPGSLLAAAMRLNR